VAAVTVERFRKKPVVIEAVRWTGDNCDEIAEFGGKHVAVDRGGSVHIKTPSGVVLAHVGDWIGHQVVNGNDDFWPIAPEIFEATYEYVLEDKAPRTFDELHAYARGEQVKP
jgi:hypothetical protein